MHTCPNCGRTCYCLAVLAAIKGGHEQPEEECECECDTELDDDEQELDDDALLDGRT